ncbi:DNA polymerase [Clostridia bacterium]|nr:DNA polymerase [Clostridia bacterium]
MKELCVAIDGNSLMYRAFHALPDTLTDREGHPTNAVFGFMMMFLKLLAEHKPTSLAVAFDVHGPTRRHLRYAEYKGTRPPTPEILRPQFPMLKELLGEMGVAMLSLEGWEADDLLGTLSKQCESRGLPSLVVTGDRDSFQLISDNTHVLYTKRGVSDTVELDPQTLFETYGVTPAQIPDLKGLMGDASDNIPGIAGIGEKTAVKLLTEYGTLTNALAAASEQKGKLRERLETGADSALLSLELATIDRAAPVDIDWDALALPSIGGLCVKARPIFERRGFNSILARLDAIIADQGSPPSNSSLNTQQASTKHVVINLEDLPALERFIQTDALNASPERPFALHVGESLTFANDTHLWRAPLANDLLSPGIQPTDALRLIRPLLDTPEAWMLADAKPLFIQLGHTPPPGSHAAWDATLAAALLGSGKIGSLSDLLEPGQPADAASLFDLALRQKRDMSENGMLNLYESVERPLTGVLIGMERAGFLLDQNELRSIGKRLTEQESRLREDIFAEIGVPPFNLNSPKQLGQALFEDLKLPAGRKNKSGYSTDAETLEALSADYPVVAKILDWRHTVKLQSTYIDGLLGKLDPQGRVHSTFFQTAAVTGRISSSEPNLQNIPTRTAQGREIRRAFTAPEGWLLVDADYSQIELRILAHLAGDPRMTDAFARAEDIHKAMAAEVNGVAIDQVTPAMRSAAKAVNFGIVYGQSDYGLARSIGVTRAEAADMIERYFARYPDIRRYLDDCVTHGKANGYVTTLMGRRRPLPELLSANHATRKFGERAAMNAPVQGSAADIIKLAMVRVAQALSGMRSRLILQVHDELILESPEDEAEYAAQILKDQMQNAARLSVPLVVDVGVGRSWFDTH